MVTLIADWLDQSLLKVSTTLLLLNSLQSCELTQDSTP
jgi:hypothetical protein